MWAAPGHDKATLGLLFDALGAERAALISRFGRCRGLIADVVTERARMRFNAPIRFWLA